MSAARRVLVLGATGMLGHVAIEVLGERFDVHGTVRDRERAERHGIEAELHLLEASDGDGLAAVLDRVRPDAVVNCVGLVKQLEEASRPVAAITVNGLFPHQLAEACAVAGARLVQVGTDCVYSGELDPPAAYAEHDPPDPCDLYGRTKLIGELEDGDVLTLRTSLVGWELDRASGLLEWFVSQEGPAVKGFTNARFSGLSTHAFSRALAELLSDHAELRGVYHLSSAPIAKFDLLVMLRDALGLEREIVPVDEPHVNRALDSTRLRSATGVEVPAWQDMSAELARLGRPGRTAG